MQWPGSSGLNINRGFQGAPIFLFNGEAPTATDSVCRFSPRTRSGIAFPCICRRTYRERKTKKTKSRRRSKSDKAGATNGASFKLILAVGDAIMIAATHLASNVIPLEDQPALITTVVLTWFVVALVKGDYTPGDEQSSRLAKEMGYNVFYSITGVLLTWVLFVPVSLVCYASLVSQNLVDPGVIVGVVPGRDVSAELEVLLSVLVTLACWRGTHTLLGIGERS